jgi:hypothetical protein
MTRPTTKLLLAGLIAAAFLATAGAGTAGAVIRTYSITFSGGVAEAYSASDSTAFDIQRAGYSGCDYTQHGDLTVFWRSVWHLRANVHPRTGHFQVLKIKRASGPFDKSHRGESEISGENTNESPSSSCSDGNRAGTYDCTAETVRPTELTPAKVTPDPSEPKTDVLELPAFSGVRASYSGKSPSGLTCANSIGSNLFPGGFIAQDFAESGDITVRYRHSLLVGLHGKKKIESTIRHPESHAWDVDPWVQQGESCALNEHGEDEVCSYTAVTRGGTIAFRRIG